MKSNKSRKATFTSSFLIPIVLVGFIFSTHGSYASIEVIPPGSFIVNMGVQPQTVGNALKPYGMIYDLIKNHGVPVAWVIKQDKVKDGIDFTYNGIDYRGGPFIIRADFRTAAVNARITYWTTTQGVVGVTTTVPIEVDVFRNLTIAAVPNWTLDYKSGSIALPYFANAGIPPEAYGGNSSSGWKEPADLNDCDDVFVMPHADPTWATHSNLWSWNLTSKGSIWLGCHAGSALENLFNPASPSQQMDFLSKKVTASGTGIYIPPTAHPGYTSFPYAQNSVKLWINHDDPVPPYAYAFPQDPIMQFMGTMDAAMLNGSEQVYIPVAAPGSGWRPETVVGIYDPDNTQVASSAPEHRAAILAYGNGFGDPERGYVMLQASHKFSGTTAANIAAQRAFFNFSFQAGKIKTPAMELTFNATSMTSGTTQQLSFTVQPPRNINEFNTINWTSSCGGSFSPLPGSTLNNDTVIFTAPVINQPITCNITSELIDECGRSYKSTFSLIITCNLQVSNTLTTPCYGLSNGSIAMNITGGNAPFVWNWTKIGGGTGSGTGTTISGLAAGTYTVDVVSNNGTGCSKTFTITLNENSQITINTNKTNVSCNGGANGAISVTVSGGSPAYTYAWTKSGGGFTASTRDVSGLSAGTYEVIVTDSRNCTASTSVIITQPDAITITPSVNNVLCNGSNTGGISLAVTGGTPQYSFVWNDGNTSQIRTSLTAGNYSVIVTDANGCTKSSGIISITQPTALTASASATPAIACFGGTTTITVTAGGGTGTLQYSLNGGAYQESNQFDNLPAAPYVITVKDAGNCTINTNFNLTQPAPLVLNTSVTQPTCPPEATQSNADGAISLTVNGGTAGFSFTWTKNGDAFSTSQNLTNLTSGVYVVTVTDSKGCTATTSVTLTNQYENPVQPATINY